MNISKLIHNLLKRFQQNLFIPIGFLITIGVLGYLVFRQREILFEHTWHIKPIFILISLSLYGVALFGTSLVWADIVGVFGSKVKKKEHIKIFFVTNLGKRLPGSVWYVAMRAQYYQKDGLDFKFISIISGAELAVIIASGVVMSSLFSIPVLLRYPQGFWGIGIMAILCFVFLNPRVLSWLVNKFGGDPSQLQYQRILLWIGAHCLIWIISSFMFISNIYIFYSLGRQLISFIIGCYILVGVLTFLLLFFPTNLGLSEIGLSVLLSLVIPGPFAVISVLTNRLLTTIFDIVLAGFLYIQLKFFNNKLENKVANK